MQADDDDDDDNCGLIMDNMNSMADGRAISVTKANVAKEATRYAHFKTEIAFAHVKEHELVE